ncbi:MAG: cell division protein FtsQ/DivIB [Flavisolibacter sp.]
MERKKIIRKIIVLTAWFLVISGITTLLIAANRKQKTHLCGEVLIGFKGSGEKFFVEKDDVLKLIEKCAHGSLIRKPVTSVDLRLIEKVLETNPWISKADLYFDSEDGLHVLVNEREPVARVFTIAGNSFYIDSSGHKMPLLEKMSIRLPVVTGFTNARKWNSDDSSMVDQVKKLVSFIGSHAFWQAQIGQIDITADKKFELIPVIGNHVIQIGDASNLEEKMNRLYVFYKQVLSKVGFNKYAAINVQYKGQVVAVNKGETSAVDSVQLLKNIWELMNNGNQQETEDGITDEPNTSDIKNDSTVSKTATQIKSVSTKTNPNPLLIRQTNSNPAKTNSKPIEEKKLRQPKAVMREN